MRISSRRLSLALCGLILCVFAVVCLALAAQAATGATGAPPTTTTPPATTTYSYDRTSSNAQGAISTATAGAFWLGTGLAGFLAAESASARFVVDSAGETRIFVRAGDESLEVSQHAALRITQRGLTVDKVEAVVNDAQPFRYYHAGTWKTGYYDAGSRVFVGSSNGTITTVINDASPNYINNLRAARP
jgi:hypothetical protein